MSKLFLVFCIFILLAQNNAVIWESYIEPDYSIVEQNNLNKIDHIMGFNDNYRKVDEKDAKYNDMFNWTDAGVMASVPSIDNKVISDENQTYVYWGWGEEHIKKADRYQNATEDINDECYGKVNEWHKTLYTGQELLYPATLTFEYYNVSKTVPITFMYPIGIWKGVNDPDEYVYTTYDEKGEKIVIGTGWDEAYNKYIYPKIYAGLSKYYSDDEIKEILRRSNIKMEDSDVGKLCYRTSHDCEGYWLYYYINPVPVPFNQNEYNTLFNEYNNREYNREPILKVNLYGIVNVRKSDYHIRWIKLKINNQTKCTTTLDSGDKDYGWEDKSHSDTKEYFVQQGDIEWFHITPVLGEEINENPEEEYVTFSNRQMQRGYSLIDGQVLTNYYIKKFEIYQDELDLYHMLGKTVNKIDFTPPNENDPLIPTSFEIPHQTKTDQSEKQYSPYQITKSNNSYRWVNYYLINFTMDDGTHNFTHIYYDTFGNEFTLSRNLTLRKPTWIINGKVNAYKQGEIGKAQKNQTAFWNIYYYNGSDDYRPSIAVEKSPELHLPDIALLIGTVGIAVLSIFIGGQIKWI